MKIEKINDHQIRCTLTREDLASRHLKISELAYGSEKTRALFQDMMSQASMDFGFEADDIPLMIEAIPLSPEKIVLIITKVDSPDELDLRFSNFTHSGEEEDEESGSDDLLPPDDNTADDLLDLLDQIKEDLSSQTSPARDSEDTSDAADQIRLFTFTDIDTVIAAAQAVVSVYRGNSILYRDPFSSEYHLFLHRSPHTAMEFNKVVHAVDSYLGKRKYTPGIEAYCREHCKVILPRHALQTLAEIQ